MIHSNQPLGKDSFYNLEFSIQAQNPNTLDALCFMTARALDSWKNDSSSGLRFLESFAPSAGLPLISLRSTPDPATAWCVLDPDPR